MAGSSSPCGTCSLRGQQLFARLPTFQQVGVGLGAIFGFKRCSDEAFYSSVDCQMQWQVLQLQASSTVTCLADSLHPRHMAVPCPPTFNQRISDEHTECGRYVFLDDWVPKMSACVAQSTSTSRRRLPVVAMKKDIHPKYFEDSKVRWMRRTCEHHLNLLAGKVGESGLPRMSSTAN